MSHPPRFRIAWASVYWRAFAAVAIFTEVGLWIKLRPWLQHRDGGSQVAAMLFRSPKPLGRAFLWAAVATIAVDLYVQLVMRPLLTRWHAPRRSPLASQDRLAFGLAPGETIQAECPARLLVGRRGEPGTLVRTDRAVWFAPRSWDAPARSIALADLREVATVAAPGSKCSLLLGTPDRLVLTGCGGVCWRALTADPAAALGWLRSAVA